MRLLILGFLVLTHRHPHPCKTLETQVLAELHPESCIHFKPALPADKVAAIKRLRFDGGYTRDPIMLVVGTLKKLGFKGFGVWGLG